MLDLKKQLIKLGSTNPELRPHIRPLLTKLAAGFKVDPRWQGKHQESLETLTPEKRWGKLLLYRGILDITAQDFLKMRPTLLRTTHEGKFYEDPRMGDEGPQILVDRKGNVIRTDEWD